jgi:hypothetical protein
MRLNDSVFGGLRTKESAYYVFRDDGTRGTGRLGIKFSLQDVSLSSIVSRSESASLKRGRLASLHARTGNATLC